MLHASRDLSTVRIQDVGPEGLQVPPELIQAVAPHRVQTAVAARLDAHQPRLFEYLRPAHRGAGRFDAALRRDECDCLRRWVTNYLAPPLARHGDCGPFSKQLRLFS